MREPHIDIDGWCLEDGEERHHAAPGTFWIPDRARRENLQPGDLAKLIFSVRIDNPEDPIAVERMWVIVRERVPGGYMGVLDNDPTSIEENDELWSGIELPFAARHIINIEQGNENTIRALAELPKRRWQTLTGV
jgi:hypothetical protein